MCPAPPPPPPPPLPPPPAPPLPPPAQTPPPPKPCNCRSGPQSCPLAGRCIADGSCVVYCCTVTRTDNNSNETYTGMTIHFKKRLYSHASAERNPEKSKSSKLSGYLWSLKLNNPPIPYTLQWKIIDRGRVFNPVTRKCRLCLKEKWHIMFNQETSSLNSRSEIFNKCVHKRSFTYMFASL